MALAASLGLRIGCYSVAHAFPTVGSAAKGRNNGQSRMVITAVDRHDEKLVHTPTLREKPDHLKQIRRPFSTNFQDAGLGPAGAEDPRRRARLPPDAVEALHFQT